MGMLDFLNTPQGVGLLSGVASYAMNARRGTPWNNMGRGLAGGLLGYQQANEIQRLDAEKQKAEAEKQQRAQLMRDAFQAGNVTTTTPGQQVQVPMARLGSNMFANPQDAQDFAATNRTINEMMAGSASPSSVGPAQTFALPKKQPPTRTPIGPRVPDESDLMAQVYGEAASPMQKTQDGYAHDLLVATAPTMPQEAEQVTQDAYSFTTPEQTRQDFDPRKAALAMLNSGDLELMQTGWKLLSETQKAAEYGTTPFIGEDGNAYLIGKDGTIRQTGLKGQQKPDANPLGKDVIEYLAVNGIDYRNATPNQLQNAYRVVSENKDRRAPRTTVTVGPTRVENITTQESEGSKVYGRGLGEMQVEIQREGFTAPTRIANLDRMAQLLEGVDSGRLSGAGMEAARFAKSFGLNVDPKLGNKQAAEALAIEMALSMRPPGSGPMTDKDFENYLNTVPSLAKTAEGRKEITATLKAKARRDLEISKMAREYARKNRGVLDDNFLDQVAEYMARNPIVPIARDYGGGWKMEKVK